MSAACVAALFRYPVKSMDGGEISRAEVGPRGIAGDRGWALREISTGRVLSAKRHAALMLCRARFVGEPALDAPPPPAEIELPDGTRARTDDPRSAALLSRFLGVESVFERAEPGTGRFDARPIHLLTTATLASMRAKHSLDFDVRRFRPNVLIALDGDGRPEDAWPGKTIAVGGRPVNVLKTVERCVMTTLPQPGVYAEKKIFSSVFADGGRLGVYAEPVDRAAWSVGDPVTTPEAP